MADIKLDGVFSSFGSRQFYSHRAECETQNPPFKAKELPEPIQSTPVTTDHARGRILCTQ
ncbi:hypothetical protein JMJ77_0013567 [Colletotrichum scovillei]|uniref:Uncharacterized protein n=1 Tax=Colletotrichum scovillei TaxID=1209932 RepID=A0A9P7R7L8_9PEZI|nr:hypothetical protein JMJ77_0013567 [Colletotrichum scovillei]KAG7069868.1 hypothetical protein JMJ76_0003528 [Colletotrichum scovillei]KAG7073822.1 hypothetical protein JMJ78_0014789 [Colletotrichum scovillei]